MNKISNNLDARTKILTAIFAAACIIFSPFYVYASGLPQPAHIAMLLASLAILILNWKRCIGYLNENKLGVAFVSLVLIINTFYFLRYGDTEFLVSCIYWVYGLILLTVVLCVGENPVVTRLVRAFIWISFICICLAYFFGLGSYTWWPRYEYFFNGPNQLAYYAICMLLTYYSSSDLAINKKFMIVYSLAVFAVLITGGRSAYLALVPLVILFVFNARGSAVKIILLLAIPLAMHAAFKPLCLPIYIHGSDGNQYIGCPSSPAQRAARVVSANTMSRISELNVSGDESQYNSVITQLAARGYMRAVKYPEYLLYGAGQGKDERFGDVGGYVYEIHSSIVAVWFYYGVLGLVLFSLFIWRLFRNKINILFLLPIFVYGLFTYGLRSPYFWVAVGFLSIMPPAFLNRKNQ